MSEGSFESKSDKNDIEEALAEAIATAKIGLRSERVQWRLEEVSGVDGGFIPSHDLTVKIHARSVAEKKVDRHRSQPDPGAERALKVSRIAYSQVASLNQMWATANSLVLRSAISLCKPRRCTRSSRPRTCLPSRNTFNKRVAATCLIVLISKTVG